MYNRLKIHFRCVESSRKIHVEWVIEPSHSRDPDCILFIAQLEERMCESWVRMSACGPTKWSYEFCLFTTLESRALPLSLTIHSLFYITRDRKPLPEPRDTKHCQKWSGLNLNTKKKLWRRQTLGFVKHILTEQF